MKINCCEYCDSGNVKRDRYIGASFIVTLVLTAGLGLIAVPFLPVTVSCRDCGAEYIAS